MRILQIGLSSVKGGIESFVLNYARVLKNEGIIFDYVDIYGAGLACIDEMKRLGGKIYTLPDYKRNYAKSKKMLEQIITNGGYKHVHINMLSAASLMAVRASLKAGVTPIIHAHSSGTVGFLRNILNYVNRKKLLKMPAFRVACGREAGEWLHLDAGFDVVPNGIYVENFRFSVELRKKIRESMGITEGELVLGYVGRLEEQKNPGYLIDILAAVKKLREDVKLVVIGDGSLKANVLEAARRKSVLGEICFVGVQNNVAPWYSVFDAFLIPSLNEGFPVVSIEAQAAGLPCFISDTVTDEVKMIDKVHYCALTSQADNWADEIVSESFTIAEREMFADVIKESEYYIINSALKLKHIYDKVNGEL